MYHGKLGVFRVQSTLTCQKACGSGGIRTHAPEETGALNQRLRPLGHATPVLAHPALIQKLTQGLVLSNPGNLQKESYGPLCSLIQMSNTDTNLCIN